MFGFLKRPAEPEGPPPMEFDALIVAKLNARVQPIERGEYYEDPLDAALKAKGLGEVTGGGTQLADAPDGIAFCEIEVSAKDTNPETVQCVIDTLEQAGAPVGSSVWVADRDDRIAFGKTEGMALFLNGTDLPDEVYQTSDVNEIIANLNKLLDGVGAFRGYYEGPRETALYFYGTSFDTMYALVKDYLDSDPGCEKTRVVQIA